MAIAMMLSLIFACGTDGGGNNAPETSIDNGSAEQSTKIPDTVNPEPTGTQEPLEPIGSKGEDEHDQEQTNDTQDSRDNNLELLQSASIDLNGDGHNEQVEAVRLSLGQTEEADSQEEGLLRIKEGDSQKQLSFWRKENGLSGILTSMEFEDLDGDGAKDIFIIIPGSGASFSYSNYFIYSYKKDSSYTFTSDNTLADFIEGFRPVYINGGNKLTLANEEYDFYADLSIDGLDQEDLEESMHEYVNRVWIEPVSINISDSSRLMLKKAGAGKSEIKVPLPIFGLATVDMIGELDLFFRVDSSFRPVLARFEVLDFVDTDAVKVGSWEMGSE